jgi:molybdopterin-guanine dinucleotide biosynthesis protein A
MKCKNHAAIILAGGQSRRMGRNKALLPLPGKEPITFVEHLVALFHSYCREVVLVARDAQQAADYASIPNVQLVTDVQPDIGPLMGLYTGLRVITCSHALVTAVDMPFVQIPMIEFLLAQPLDDALRVPVVDGIPQVLFAIYPKTILPLVEQRLQEGRRDPRSLLDMAHVCYIEEAQLRSIEPELRSFVNVNTPQELACY